MARTLTLTTIKGANYDENAVEISFRAFRKMTEELTIKVSRETYDKLSTLQTNLKKILHKPVSFDALIKVLFEIDNTDGVIVGLSEYLREDSIDKGMKE